MVLNCTAGIERKLQKIEGVVAPVERYLTSEEYDIRRITGCVKWWCPILSGCWPEVGLNIFK
jgi:hypothetical protein